jgi:hypothetical protein
MGDSERNDTTRFSLASASVEADNPTPLMGRWLDLWLEALQQPIRGARRREG